MDKSTKYVVIVMCALLLLVFTYSFFQSDNSTIGTNEVSRETFQAKDENVPLKVLDKISVWKKASFDQRFSLCTAMSVQLNKDLKGEKITARDLHNCVEEATRGLDEANDLTIIQVASLCVSKLK